MSLDEYTLTSVWESNYFRKHKCEALAELLRVLLGDKEEDTAMPAFDESVRHQDTQPRKADDNDDEADDRSGPINLKRAFLDRLAEVLVNDLGSQSVAATMMLAPGSRGSIHVYVARNTQLSATDRAHLENITAHLRQIASQHQYTSEQAEALFKALLAYQEPRIQGYVSALQIILLNLRDALEIAGDTADKEALLQELRELKRSAFASYSSVMERNDVLVRKAYQIVHPTTTADFNNLPFSGALELRNALGLLSLLGYTTAVFLRAAREIPGFALLQIQELKQPEASITASETMIDQWTISELYCYLGIAGGVVDGRDLPYKINPDEIHSALSPFYPELQMVSLYEDAENKVDPEFAVRYIGCSKVSGFLCSFFYDRDASYKTRRSCDGDPYPYDEEMYEMWAFPVLHGLTEGEARRALQTLENIEACVVRKVEEIVEKERRELLAIYDL